MKKLLTTAILLSLVVFAFAYSRRIITQELVLEDGDILDYVGTDFNQHTPEWYFEVSDGIETITTDNSPPLVIRVTSVSIAGTPIAVAVVDMQGFSAQGPSAGVTINCKLKYIPNDDDDTNTWTWTKVLPSGSGPISWTHLNGNELELPDEILGEPEPEPNTYTLKIYADTEGTLMKDDDVELGTPPWEMTVDEEDIEDLYGTYYMAPKVGGTWSEALVINAESDWQEVRAAFQKVYTFEWTPDPEPDVYNYYLTLNVEDSAYNEGKSRATWNITGPADSYVVEAGTPVTVEALELGEDDDNPIAGDYSIALAPTGYYWAPSVTQTAAAEDFAAEALDRDGETFNYVHAALTWTLVKEAPQMVTYTLNLSTDPEGHITSPDPVEVEMGEAPEALWGSYAPTSDPDGPGYWEPEELVIDADTEWMDSEDENGNIFYHYDFEFVWVPIEIDTYTLRIYADIPGMLMKGTEELGTPPWMETVDEDEIETLYGTYYMQPIAGGHWEPEDLVIDADTVWDPIRGAYQYIHFFNWVEDEPEPEPPLYILILTTDPEGHIESPIPSEDVEDLYGTYAPTSDPDGLGHWEPAELVIDEDFDEWMDSEDEDGNLFYYYEFEFVWVVDEEPPVPVELSSFTATVNAVNNVELSWVSQSENHMVGYRVLRSENADQSGSITITPVIIPATNTSSAQSYKLTDNSVDIGQTYHYWLEAVDYLGSSFHGPVSVTVIGNVPPVLPEVTSMKNAYPNPFKAGNSTNIEVALKAGETGSLTIYNVMGQVVRTVSLTEGNHTINWNGRDSKGTAVGSGIYFYKLSTPSLNQTKKMVIVK